MLSWGVPRGGAGWWARCSPGGGAPPLAYRLAASALTGALTELFLIGLVILGQQANLRPVFPNASPELWELLQFGLSAPQSYFAMLGFGAIGGLLGAGLT